MIVFAGNFPRRKILRRAAGATPCHKRFNYKSALFSCWQIHKDFTAEQNCFPRHIGQTLGPPICHFAKIIAAPQFFQGGNGAGLMQMWKKKTGRTKCIRGKMMQSLTGALVPYLICIFPTDADIDIHSLSLMDICSF